MGCNSSGHAYPENLTESEIDQLDSLNLELVATFGSKFIAVHLKVN